MRKIAQLTLILASIVLISGCVQKRAAENENTNKQPTTQAEQKAETGSTQEKIAPEAQPKTEPVVTQETNQNEITVHFGFNRRNLAPASRKNDTTAEDRAKLDALAERLISQDVKSITITGHADQLEGGGNPGNIKRIAEERAQVVKDYWVKKTVPATLITTQGKGKTMPVTTKGQCDGPLSRQTLICLQPNRRVEIVVEPK